MIPVILPSFMQRRECFHPNKGSAIVSCDLTALMHNDKTVRLLAEIVRKEQADLIAAEINAFLGH